MRRGERAGNRDERGMALLITLLVVAILTAAVVEFAYGVYVSTNALHNWQTAQRLSLAAKSATRLGARLITANALMYPYTYPGQMEITQKIPFDEIDGTILLRIEDENSKFNLNSLVGRNGMLNAIQYDSLLRMLKALGLKKEIAYWITDWIDPDAEPRLRDSENAAKNGYLDSIDELLLIPGIDRESYERLAPYVTIYGAVQLGDPAQININGAAVPVLMSLSDGINADMAQKIVRYRDATPFTTVGEFVQLTGVGQDVIGLIAIRGMAFRVLATAQSGNIKRIIESVIDIRAGRVIKYWKES
jgi:general secretion pathway protein K